MNCYTSEKRPLQFFCFEICIVNIILRFSHIVSFFRVAAPKHINVTNGSGRTGTTTELSCTYEGRPLPTIKWLGFGKDLTQVWLLQCRIFMIIIMGTRAHISLNVLFIWHFGTLFLGV